MSGLFGSLTNGVKALNAQSRAVETAGRNLANVNNTNYARQRVIFGDRGTVITASGPESMGLEAMGVEQLRDRMLDQQVLNEVSRKAALTAAQSGLQKAQAGLGQHIASASSTDSATNGAQGIAESLASFFNSFQSFAAKPTDVGERQTLVQNAAILTDRLNLTDARLAQTQSDLTAQVSGDVQTINSLLTTIAALNGQIGRFELTNPGSAIDLRDQRQAKLEELAGKMSFETREITGGSGQIEVFARDASGNEVSLIDRATVNGSVTFDGTNISGGSPATVLALSSGSIKGSLDVRDGAVQTLRDELNALTAQLVESVNTAYGPTGATFFNATGTTAGTIKLATGLTASTLKASAGGAAGDNTIALAIANLANQTFTTPTDYIDGTLSQHYNRAVTDLGQALTSANARLEDQTTIEKLVRSQRDSVSGVSLDEEMADLMKYQRAFQASSRVIQTIDELLDTVVNRLGA